MITVFEMEYETTIRNVQYAIGCTFLFLAMKLDYITSLKQQNYIRMSFNITMNKEIVNFIHFDYRTVMIKVI